MHNIVVANPIALFTLLLPDFLVAWVLSPAYHPTVTGGAQTMVISVDILAIDAPDVPTAMPF
jgi:hypothetical protein